MDNIIAFFAGYLLSSIGLGFLVIASFLCSSRENNFFSVVFGAMAITVLVKLQQIPLIYVAYAVPAYLLAGLVWSMWRYRRYVHKRTTNVDHLTISDRKHLLARLKPSRMKGAIVAWVLAWPFSMVGALVEDLTHAVEHIITEWLGGVYKAIFKGAEERLAMSETEQEPK